MADLNCPRCGASVHELHFVTPAVLNKIREGGNQQDIPDQICDKCMAEVAGKVARGSVLMAMERAKEVRKTQMWKSRVLLFKRAQLAMREKLFSQAAASYEKYLRLLEMIFEVKHGELTPEHFKDGAKTKELTLVTNTFWDLVRIYDGNPSFRERQMASIKKLAVFAQYTPVYADYLKKAKSFLDVAKNPDHIKILIKELDAGRKGCFVATLVFDDGMSPEVQFFRQFRDESLNRFDLGKKFVHLYYVLSPFLIRGLSGQKLILWALRPAFRTIYGFLAARQRDSLAKSGEDLPRSSL